MEIFHIDRDYNKTLEQQKSELRSEYIDFYYLFADGATGNPQIHFMAEGKRSHCSLSGQCKGRNNDDR